MEVVDCEFFSSATGESENPERELDWSDNVMKEAQRLEIEIFRLATEDLPQTCKVAELSKRIFSLGYKVAISDQQEVCDVDGLGKFEAVSVN